MKVMFPAVAVSLKLVIVVLPLKVVFAASVIVSVPPETVPPNVTSAAF